MVFESEITTNANLPSELRSSIVQLNQIIGDNHLLLILQSYERFHQPEVYVEDESGNRSHEPYYELEKYLKEIPNFINIALQAGLTLEQSIELLLHTLNSNPYEFEDNGPITRALTNALSVNVADKALDNDGFLKLKELIGLSAKYGVLVSALSTYSYMRRTGISNIDSVTIIILVLMNLGHLAGYVMSYLKDAAYAFIHSGIDLDLVRRLFQSFVNLEQGNYHYVYPYIEILMAFEYPNNKVYVEELLELIIGAKDNEDALSAIMERESEKASSNGSNILPALEYFKPKAGRLEHLAQPYSIKLSLRDGRKDLERLALADPRYGEKVAEGYWVFDPESETWYSFGGITSFERDSLQHRRLPFSLSPLSKTPYVFHIQPKQLEYDFAPQRLPFPMSAFTYQLGTLYAMTPSRQDYLDSLRQIESEPEIEPRFFIIHSHGTTEYTVSGDASLLEVLDIKFREIRDQATLNFDWQKTVSDWNPNKIKNFDRNKLVRALMKEINKLLPESAKLKLYPKVDRE